MIARHKIKNTVFGITYDDTVCEITASREMIQINCTVIDVDALNAIKQMHDTAFPPVNNSSVTLQPPREFIPLEPIGAK